MTRKEDVAKMVREMRDQARADNGDLIASMPAHAETAGQLALMEKHGSPRAYANAVVNAIGEISCLEAHAAIARYKAEWDAA